MPCLSCCYCHCLHYSCPKTAAHLSAGSLSTATVCSSQQSRSDTDNMVLILNNPQNRTAKHDFRPARGWDNARLSSRSTCQDSRLCTRATTGSDTTRGIRRREQPCIHRTTPVPASYGSMPCMLCLVGCSGSSTSRACQGPAWSPAS